MRIALPVCLLFTLLTSAIAGDLAWRADGPDAVSTEIRTSGKPGLLLFVSPGKTDAAETKLVAALSADEQLQSVAPRAVFARFDVGELKTGQRYKFRSWRVQFPRAPGVWLVDAYGKVRKKWSLERCTAAAVSKELTRQVSRAPGARSDGSVGSRTSRGRVSVPAKKKGQREETVTFDGKPYTYWVRVPSTYNARVPHKAIILCHGNGDTAQNFLRMMTTQSGGEASKWLWISLEKCDNIATGTGLIPKYITELKKVYNFEPRSTFMISFSGGGFRSWGEIVTKESEMRRLRGVALFGCGQTGGSAPTWKPGIAKVSVIGDPKDPNYNPHGKQAVAQLEKRGYKPRNVEHAAGHTVPSKELKETIGWFNQLLSGR